MAGTRVFVGNLDWKITSQDLKAHMGQVGEVAYANVFGESEGRSRGNGVVEYRSPASAEAAIAQLSDTQLGERTIFVREDRDGGKKGGKGGFGKGKGKGDYGKNGFGKGDFNGGGYGGKDGGSGKGKGKGKGDSFGFGPQDAGRVIYVGNLPFRMGWQDLKDTCRQHGEVVRVEIAQDMDGRSKGYATVLFDRAEDAENAVDALHDTEFMGRLMKLRMYNVM